MSGSHHLSRRTALAGLGAGSLGLVLGSHAAANPHQANRESGRAPDIAQASTTAHPLNGRWLAMLGLPSNELLNVAVPTVLSPDGTAIMIFPGTEAAKRGIEIRGIAVGEWEAVDDDTGHFTIVQVLSNLDGNYMGTVTVDGTARLSHDGLRFSVAASDRFYTVRDGSNNVIDRIATSSINPMRAFRMHVGNAGFPDTPLPRLDTPSDPQ